jgi:adenylylsulfate kinase-like enzyme
MTHTAEFTLWFTGMSGAGKSTLAAAIRDELRALGQSRGGVGRRRGAAEPQ